MVTEIVNREAEKDRFQLFLMNIDDVIDDFIEEAKLFGVALDFSESSLETLEAYYLRRESELNKNDKKKSSFIESAARYLGETLIKIYGGKWTLAIDDPKDLYYGLPVIIGHSKYDVEFCPHQIFRMFTRKRKSGFFRQVIQNHINPIKLELTPE